jgi:CLIP-associating protein 1/2
MQSESKIEYGLIVLWEVLEHLASCIEGREADIFAVLLKIRYCNQGNVSWAKQ